MALSVTNVGQNGFAPGISAEAFIPDQLIAGGQIAIVTDTVTLVSGAGALKRGTVLGRITLGAATATAAAGNTGNGTFSLVTRSANAVVGNYTVRFTGATTFTVTNPLGHQLRAGGAAGAYDGGEIGFTFTAGGTAMVAGDSFTVAVAAGSGKYLTSLTAATDGSATPVAILVDDVDATSADKLAGVYKEGEFNGAALTLGTGHTLASIKDPLELRSIYVRTAVSAADPT